MLINMHGILTKNKQTEQKRKKIGLYRQSSDDILQKTAYTALRNFLL
jgi:hypothetical protein